MASKIKNDSTNRENYGDKVRDSDDRFRKGHMENECQPRLGTYYQGMAIVSSLWYGGDQSWHSSEWINKMSTTCFTILKPQQQQ